LNLSSKNLANFFWLGIFSNAPCSNLYVEKKVRANSALANIQQHTPLAEKLDLILKLKLVNQSLTTSVILG